MMLPVSVFFIHERGAFLESAIFFLFDRVDVAMLGHADSFDEALPEIISRRPDVVLVAMELRESSGLAAAVRLKALPCPPRVVILSDREEHSYRELAVAVRADAYVLKRQFATVVPFVLKDLRNRTTTAEADAE